MGPALIAKAAWDAMWGVYDRKYGKFGEKRVRKLQAVIVKKENQLAALRAESAWSREVIADQAKMLDALEEKHAALRENYDALVAVANERARDDLLAEPIPYED